MCMKILLRGWIKQYIYIYICKPVSWWCRESFHLYWLLEWRRILVAGGWWAVILICTVTFISWKKIRTCLQKICGVGSEGYCSSKWSVRERKSKWKYYSRVTTWMHTNTIHASIFGTIFLLTIFTLSWILINPVEFICHADHNEQKRFVLVSLTVQR